MVLQIYGRQIGQKDFFISIQGACATEIGGDSRVQGVVGMRISALSNATCFAVYAQTQK